MLLQDLKDVIFIDAKHRRLDLDALGIALAEVAIHNNPHHIPSTAKPAVRPPSATNSAPVQYELSSLARKRASLAISSGRPMRPSGSRWNQGLLSVSMPAERTSGVSTPPGRMVLTRIPCAPSSIAPTLLRPRTEIGRAHV